MSDYEIKNVQAFDGSWTPYRLDPLPCGGVPTFDEGSGYSYRCDICGAVIGSIGMPRACNDAWREETEKKEMWARLEKTNGL
jgi:hypothetical protein